MEFVRYRAVTCTTIENRLLATGGRNTNSKFYFWANTPSSYDFESDFELDFRVGLSRKARQRTWKDAEIVRLIFAGYKIICGPAWHNFTCKSGPHVCQFKELFKLINYSRLGFFVSLQLVFEIFYDPSGKNSFYI